MHPVYYFYIMKSLCHSIHFHVQYMCDREPFFSPIVVSILNLNDEEKPQENIGKFEDNKEEEEEVEMEGEGDEEEDKVVEKLKKLIYVVEQCLQSNQGMQSTELTRTSTELLETYDSMCICN